MPGVCETWPAEMPPAGRECAVCGAITVSKKSRYCFSHISEELAEEPSSPHGQPAQEEPLEPSESHAELFNRHGQPAESDGQPAQEPPEPSDSHTEPSSPHGQPAEFSKQYASKLRNELRDGKTVRGQPLSEEQRQAHIVKLRRRVFVLPIRFQGAELARINELEVRFVGHLEATATEIKTHVDAALEPLIARAEGRMPPRREGQSAAQRKFELDQSMLAMRNERREIVAEERREREERPKKCPRTPINSDNQ